MRRRGLIYAPSTDAYGLGAQWDASLTGTGSITGPAGAAITNNAAVQFFKSQIGTTRKFAQSFSQTVPTWKSAVMNGLGAINFDAAPRVMDCDVMTGFASLSGVTFLVVFQASASAGGFQSYLTFGLVPSASPQILGVGIGTNNNNVFFGGRRTAGDAFAGAISSATISVNTTHVLLGTINFATGLISLWMDGVLVATGAMASTGSTSATDVPVISLGGITSKVATGTGDNVSGLFGEALAWPSCLTPDQAVFPMTYARLKWGSP